MRRPQPENQAVWVALVAFLLAALLLAANLVLAGGDSMFFVRLGTRFSQNDPAGSEGYDGQFNYFIARYLDAQVVAPFLDVPAYRYQRILYPLLARLLAFGNEDLLPWSLLLIGLLSIPFAVLPVARMLGEWGVSPWYALVWGLWPGLLLALVCDLSEPLAFGLAAWGLWAWERKKYRLSWFFLLLATFGKEVTLVFAFALLLDTLVRRQFRLSIGLIATTFLPFALFQGWLWLQFGAFGAGSGGAMATSFELIPFMGFWRIAASGLPVFLVFGIVFAPSILLPTILALWGSWRAWSRGERNVIVFSLAINCLLLLSLPFSTFREPAGLLRFASGFVLAVILFAGHYRLHKVLNYSILWMALNVFLLKR